MEKQKQLSELSASEVEEIAVKLANDGVEPSRIGVILRDQYSVPDIKRATGKKLMEILHSRGIKPEIPEDLAKVILMAVKLYSHLERNKNDLKSKRSLEVIESRINKLSKYYKRKGLIPADWRYDRTRAALLVR